MRPSHHAEDPERPRHVYARDLRARVKRREYIEATDWTEALRVRGWRSHELRPRRFSTGVACDLGV